MRTYNKKDVFSLVNAEEARQYIGSKGYFADSFKKLDERVKADRNTILADVTLANICCFSIGDTNFGLFIPCDKVIEKQPKYRPYKSIDEFCEHHELGEFISIRRKDEPKSFGCMMFTGYQHINAEIECPDVIYLGGSFYSLNGLFDNYEFENTNGDFVPFGVEE